MEFTKEQLKELLQGAALEGARENWNGEGCISIEDTKEWIEDTLNDLFK